ncbi:MAG: endonuclease/exonuclease/phosphatase family protein [Pseudomonadota bacterium]
MTTLTKLRCATWNVHRGRGAHGRVEPARATNAIETDLGSLSLDVLALQEADEEIRPHRRIFDAGQIASVTGLKYLHNEDRLRWSRDSDGFLGTVLFINPTLRIVHSDVIDLPGHCHRGAVSVEIDTGSTRFRIMSTHLSLSQPLRIVQMRIIGQYLRRRPAMQTVLLGDLNEWRPWGGLMFNGRIVGTRFRGPSVPTYPSGRPLLSLDRIMTDRSRCVDQVRTIAGPRVVTASDHLPLFAEVTISDADRAGGAASDTAV